MLYEVITFEPHAALWPPLRWVCLAMGLGVILSGARDLAAANGWGVFALPFQHASTGVQRWSDRRAG